MQIISDFSPPPQKNVVEKTEELQCSYADEPTNTTTLKLQRSRRVQHGKQETVQA